MMRYIFILLTAASFLVTEAQAQKFGHINTQVLLDTLPEYQKAQEALKVQYDEYQEVLKGQEEELLALQTEIQQNQETWSQFLLQQKMQSFQDKSTRLQEAASAAEQDLLGLEQTLTAPIIEKVRVAIKEVGKESGFTYIFDLTSGAVLYDGGEDVLPLVLAKVKSMNAEAGLE